MVMLPQDWRVLGGDEWDSALPLPLRFRGTAHENERIWFRDKIHYPNAISPFDASVVLYCQMTLATTTTRIFGSPFSGGVDFRVRNGYVYLSALQRCDSEPTDVGEYRARLATLAANWEREVTDWRQRVVSLNRAAEDIHFHELPGVETVEDFREFPHRNSGFQMIKSYRALCDFLIDVTQHHFTLLVAGYANYLDFFNLMELYFPKVGAGETAHYLCTGPTELDEARTRLRILATLAVQFRLSSQILSSQDFNDLRSLLTPIPEGRSWLEAWEATADPWFNWTTGTGCSHRDATWSESPEIPLSILQRMLGEPQAEDDSTSSDDRFGLLLQHLGDDEARGLAAARDRARRCYEYVEGHNFFIEQWAHSIFWSRCRELAGALVAHGAIGDSGDLFMLSMKEVEELIEQTVAIWAIPGAKQSSAFADLAMERRATYQKIQSVDPPPALGSAAESSADPLVSMLWGISDQTISRWIQGEGAEAPTNGRELHGICLVQGEHAGPARICRSAEDFMAIQPGEVVVCEVVNPTFADYLGDAGAIVMDSGGYMSHAAIVCRELGVPAVSNLGSAMLSIRSGVSVAVYASSGRVEILHS